MSNPATPLSPTIAVVIPCFRVREAILDVLAAIGPECQAIYVVDDACPDRSGDLVEAECHDPRVHVVRLPENQGVGGAVIAGYLRALEDGAEILVKLDGDGQMDPALIPRLVAMIQQGEADYVKGNRFFELDGLQSMPTIRLIGNSLLSFVNKVSTGYWNVFDPTNGFTALHAGVARQLPFDKLSKRFFFESDMLFRLGTLRAVVTDVPMPVRYADERSNLRVRDVVFEFAWKHFTNTFKRLFYNYYLRDFSIASVEIVVGVAALVWGTWFGLTRWLAGISQNIPATSGTVMVAALPVLLGVQLILAFLNFDIHNVPRDVLHKRLLPPHEKS
ncbi:MAG: glycosyltransferase family 2 protein [Myxococcota bacterium]|jgi:glycosyltransferase involved in cell wall biosynthesis|nr:glycosyltransferase family 2 protein [Myxococcota bacterium]